MDMRRDTVLPPEKDGVASYFAVRFGARPAPSPAASPIPSGRPMTIVTRTGDIRDMGIRSKGIRILPYFGVILD
jgi:hypothetical protein